VQLTATARELSGAALVQEAGADDPATMQTVFGDGAGIGDAARDAAFTDDGSYLVVSADVTIAKTETLLNDPVNGAATCATSRAPSSVPGDGHQRRWLSLSPPR
jgi:hypothetical protein